MVQTPSADCRNRFRDSVAVQNRLITTITIISRTKCDDSHNLHNATTRTGPPSKTLDQRKEIELLTAVNVGHLSPRPGRPMTVPNVLPTDLQHFQHFLAERPGYLSPPTTLCPIFKHVQPASHLQFSKSRATKDRAVMMPELAHLVPICAQTIHFVPEAFKQQ